MENKPPRQHPIYPTLFRGTVTDFIETPCMIGNEKAWQQCYICGMSIQFNKDIGKWLNIGGTIIRHKDCDPLPYTGRVR